MKAVKEGGIRILSKNDSIGDSGPGALERNEKHQDKGSQVGSNFQMEVASQSLKQLGILTPSEVITDDGAVAREEEIKPSNAAEDVKLKKKSKTANPDSVTPTVILNGIAMARGESVSYKVYKKTPLPPQPIYNRPDKDYNVNSYSMPLWESYYYYGYGYGMKPNQNPVKRWIYPYVFHVQVTIGDRSFLGEGKSQQAARHDAARRALEVLETLPIPKHDKKSQLKKVEAQVDSTKNVKPTPKSPISIIYEKVSAARLKINFEVVSEEGPAHLRFFTMKLSIFKIPSENMITAEGKGNSKITAKTNAALAALDLLEKNPLPVHVRQKQKSANNKIPVQSPTSLHPCNRLCQILQAKREKLPTYTLISSDNTKPHETKYIMQCAVQGQTATGEGKSKKDAKRNASENMLKALGYKLDEPVPSSKVTAKIASKSGLKNKSKSTATDKLPPLIEVQGKEM